MVDSKILKVALASERERETHVQILSRYTEYMVYR